MLNAIGGNVISNIEPSIEPAYSILYIRNDKCLFKLREYLLHSNLFYYQIDIALRTRWDGVFFSVPAEGGKMLYIFFLVVVVGRLEGATKKNNNICI